MSDRILILGGTNEAAEIADRLTAAGHTVITSLAGRTQSPRLPAGKTRVGGFGGADKMAGWIARHDIDKVIDATHPFALQISSNAQIACTQAGILLEVYTRKPWQKHPLDDWIEVASLAEAATAIPTDARAFLALGSQHLEPFKTRDDVDFIVRMVDRPQNPPILPRHTLEIGSPSRDWHQERKLLQNHNITHVVCRNSGGSRSYAKIIAARALEIPVIIIKMPS